MINESAEASSAHSSQRLQRSQSKPDAPRHSKGPSINSTGVHGSVQMLLVCLLILVSLGSVFTSTSQVKQHLRYLRTYLNLNLLGNDNMGLYQEGDNIDEDSAEVVFLSDIAEHLQGVLNVTELLEFESVIAFQQQEKYEVLLEAEFLNEQFVITRFSSYFEAMEYFHHFEPAFLREFLLKINQFRLTLPLGRNQVLEDYTLIAQYNLHSFLMLSVDLSYEHTPKPDIAATITSLRTLEQLLASILFMVYVYRLILLFKTNQDREHRGWLISLAFLSLVIMLSDRWAPLAACLQIVPALQSKGETYSFKGNLRFSLSLILPIYMELLIVLNGFIFYSMLMYPGQYFDDYLLGFFSYVYQMFQVGTYEIFTQLQSQGNFAYLLYALLYFYVFQVGNSLIPALFCILIQMRINQREVDAFTGHLLTHAACPQCQHRNVQLMPQNLHIMVNSPNIAPLIDQPKPLPKKGNQQQKSDKVVLFIEAEETASPNLRYRFNVNEQLVGYTRRLQGLLRRLQRGMRKQREAEWLQQCLAKLQKLSFMIQV